MCAPKLKKSDLKEAGWLRERCSESATAICPDCGSPIVPEGHPCPEKECWVCTWRGIPPYRCSRCAELLEAYSAGGERPCQSVCAFESKAVVAFQPEGEVWFYRKGPAGKIKIACLPELRAAMESGALGDGILVCPCGGGSFQKASDHPALAPTRSVGAEPPPKAPAPLSETHSLPPSRSGKSKNTLAAVALAALFGPIGLLYLSWKLSLATLVASSAAWGILGKADWAFTLAWFIGPPILAYRVCRGRWR